MPYTRPTLDQLRQQSQGDLQSALPPADELLRYSNLRILAAMVAALVSGNYGYLDYIALQATPFTATDVFLEAWAALKSVTRKPATAASGSVIFTGAVGSTIPPGTSVLRNDGFAFVTTAAATIGDGGSVTAPLSAVAAGSTGNSDAGLSFTLTAGVSGVTATGTAAAAITGGADVETDDALRGRMLLAFANPPQGGSASDYQQWALAVPGVTRAWVTPSGMGPGTVAVLFMMDVSQAAHGGFPQGSSGVAAGETRDTVATGDQLTLANALFAKQPVTPIVYTIAPQANTIALTIAGLSGASAPVKAAIAAAFSNALFMGGVPGGTTDISVIEAAIAAVNGSAGFVITAVTATAGSVTPGGAGNIVSNTGHLPIAGAITWS